MKSTLVDIGARLGCTLLYMLALVAVSAPIAMLGSKGAAAGVAVLLWLGSAFWVKRRWGRYIDIWGIICAVVPATAVAFGMYDYVSLAAGQTATGISVAEAPRYHASRGFSFSDPMPQRKLATTYSDPIRERRSTRVTYIHYNVMPLTHDRWTPAQPVPAWIGCSDSFSKTCADWGKSCRAAIAVKETDRGGLREAVKLALSKHSLTEAPSAPLLTCVSSIKKGQSTRLLLPWLTFAFIYLIWAIPMMIYRIVA